MSITSSDRVRPLTTRLTIMIFVKSSMGTSSGKTASQKLIHNIGVIEHRMSLINAFIPISPTIFKIKMIMKRG